MFVMEFFLLVKSLVVGPGFLPTNDFKAWGSNSASTQTLPKIAKGRTNKESSLEN